MSRRVFVVAAALVVALAAGGCGSSGFRYVTNRKTGTYFKVPSNWKVFDQKEVAAGLKASGGDANDSLLFASAFDADRKPALAHFLQVDPPSAQPSGMVQVVALTDNERDIVSLKAMRNLLVPVDDGVAQSQVNVLGQIDLNPPGGLRGQRTVYEVAQASGNYVVDQSTLVDDKTQKLWLFAVGCESNCYKAQRKQIDKVVSSWTVKKR